MPDASRRRPRDLRNAGFWPNNGPLQPLGFCRPVDLLFIASYSPLVGGPSPLNPAHEFWTGDHDGGKAREKGQKAPGTHSSTGPHPTSRSTHRAPPIFASRYALDSRLCPVASEGRPCPSPTSPAFFVKPKTVSRHSSSIAFALLIPALDYARSRRRHLTATPRLHRDYGALSVLHIALHQPLSLSAAIGTLDPPNPPSGPATVHRPSGAMGGAAAATATASKPDDLQCCCGRQECAFLRHNCSVLLSVERDVHVAAKMGQVCCSAAHLHSFVCDCISILNIARVVLCPTTPGLCACGLGAAVSLCL